MSGKMIFDSYVPPARTSTVLAPGNKPTCHNFASLPAIKGNLHAIAKNNNEII
jgi:hypothetical protein